MAPSSEERQVSRNTRFMMWKREVPRDQWVSWLASRLDWPAALVSQLVRDDVADSRLGEQQVAELSIVFGMNEADQELRYRDLVSEHGSVLRENLSYLLNSLEHGGKKVLAESMGIDPTTISRWLNGSFVPHKATLQGLASYFGLSPAFDLENDPIFLSADPVAQSEQRRWVRERLDKLTKEEFRQLYPALRRILGSNEAP